MGDDLMEPYNSENFHWLVAKVMLLAGHGQHAQAMALASQAVAMAGELYGTSSVHYGHQLANLAVLQVRTGNAGTADETFEAALRVLARAEPALLPGLLASRATAQSMTGAADRAIETYEQALRLVRDRSSSIEHGDAMRVYRGLAKELAPQQAETLLREAVADPRFASDTASDSLAELLIALGETVFVQGRHNEAIELCERVLQVRQARYGDHHFLVARAMRNLGRTHRAAGQWGPAQSWLVRSAAIWRGIAADPAEQALTEADLAIAYGRAGAWDEARAAAADALATVARIADPCDPQMPRS